MRDNWPLWTIIVEGRTSSLIQFQWQSSSRGKVRQQKHFEYSRRNSFEFVFLRERISSSFRIDATTNRLFRYSLAESNTTWTCSIESDWMVQVRRRRNDLEDPIDCECSHLFMHDTSEAAGQLFLWNHRESCRWHLYGVVRIGCFRLAFLLRRRRPFLRYLVEHFPTKTLPPTLLLFWLWTKHFLTVDGFWQGRDQVQHNTFFSFSFDDIDTWLLPFQHAITWTSANFVKLRWSNTVRCEHSRCCDQHHVSRSGRCRKFLSFPCDPRARSFFI